MSEHTDTLVKAFAYVDRAHRMTNFSAGINYSEDGSSRYIASCRCGEEIWRGQHPQEDDWRKVKDASADHVLHKYAEQVVELFYLE